MNVSVCVHVTDEMKGDLYRLYCRRNPIEQVFFVVAGMAVLAISIPLLPGRGNFPPLERIFLSLMGVVLILSAFVLTQIWWRWFYWPRVQRDYPAATPPCVQLSSTGILHDANQPEFPYSGYRAFRKNERVVLLYVTKSYPVPFHRSLFATEADWQLFQDAVKEAFKHRTLLQRFDEPI